MQKEVAVHMERLEELSHWLCWKQGKLWKLYDTLFLKNSDHLLSSGFLESVDNPLVLSQLQQYYKLSLSLFKFVLALKIMFFIFLISSFHQTLLQMSQSPWRLMLCLSIWSPDCWIWMAKGWGTLLSKVERPFIMSSHKSFGLDTKLIYLWTQDFPRIGSWQI